MIFHVCQTGVTYIFRLASEPRSHELKDLKLSFYLRITASKTYWCYSVMYEAAWCLCRLFLHCVSRITPLHTSLLQHKISIHDIVMTVQLNIYLCKYAHRHFIFFFKSSQYKQQQQLPLVMFSCGYKKDKSQKKTKHSSMFILLARDQTRRRCYILLKCDRCIMYI